MPKMLEMIQQSAVPANIMRSAARGSLALPAAEMLEILVYLTHHTMFGEEAKVTLAGFDVSAAREVCSSADSPAPVLAYFIEPKNWRPVLLPALFANPAVDEHQLMVAAEAATPEVARMMLDCERVTGFKWVLKQMSVNHRIIGTAEYSRLMTLIGPNAHVEHATPHTHQTASDDTPDEEQVIANIHREHAEELAAEAHKKFELVKADSEEQDELAELVEAVVAKPDAPVEHVAAAVKKEPERLSVIQKITRMTVGERVQLAVKGTKDERFVLIRDGSKVVSFAVLESPKLSDAEMETFAAMKNVQQAVLRQIASKRKFMKQYSVIRALTSNPRAPIDVTLKLLPNLLLSDLQNLSKNKNVGDTVRKIALKLYKDKTTTRKA